jgi:hypothetical protein
MLSHQNARLKALLKLFLDYFGNAPSIQCVKRLSFRRLGTVYLFVFLLQSLGGEAGYLAEFVCRKKIPPSSLDRRSYFG